MIPALLASAALHSSSNIPERLPYAPRELVFQSAEAIQLACNAFESSAEIDLNCFTSLSQKGNYEEAYQIWSDLLFRFFSFKLELGRTLDFSLNDEVKASVKVEGEKLENSFQQKILTHPTLLNTFLNNAEAAAQLTPQQRLFTDNILKEYRETHVKEALKIGEILHKLSADSTESFAYAKGLAAPMNPDLLSELKVLSANILCFPGNLPFDSSHTASKQKNPQMWVCLGAATDSMRD